MQEQKNKRLFISLIALVLITVAVYAFTTRERTIRVDKNVFQVQDLTAIDRVTMTRGDQPVELHFNGTRWKVNKAFDADRNLVNVLFATLKQVEPKRPVAESIKDSISSILEKSGVKVSLFSGVKEARTFLAGGNDVKTQAYFKDLTSDEIYVMTIPGYRVYVSGIFELNESGWRDKTVFAFHWRNFQSLEVDYTSNKKDNFRVSMQEGVFGVETITRTDTVKLASYMDQLFGLALDEFSLSESLTDSLQKSTPDVTFTVTDIANRNYILKIFESKTEQVPALLGDNQAIIINRKRILPLLRPKSFFQLK